MSSDTSPGVGSTSGSDATRADIEATRARMGDTLEELGARLNPERLKQQAKAKVRDATIGRVQSMAETTRDKATSAGRKMTDIVRENPIPAALIAAGVSWLVFSARRSGSSTSSDNEESSHESTSSYEAGQSWNEYENQRSSGGYQNSAASNYGGESEPEIRARYEEDANAADSIRDKASAAADTTREMASRAKDTAADVAGNLAETARNQTQKVTSSFGQNPLPAGLIAAALGLAAGFAIPSTQKESDLVGEKRDELVGKARDLVQQKKQQAQHVAERVVTEAKSAATRAAREEGLTSAP